EDLEGFRSLFLRVYLGVPLAVFAIFSINHEPKLNWAGPAFLIALPFFADLLRQGRSATPAQSFVYKTWFPTLTFLLVAYAGLFLYIRYGVPFGGYFKGSQRFVGWHDLGRQLGELASAKQGSETTRTVLVGMDKHFIASEIGYYTPYWKSGAAPLPVDALAGRNIFEMNALMWEQWTPANLSGATLLLVARSKSDLEKDIVGTFVSSQDPIQEISVSSRSKKVGTYYYRWAYNYKPRPQ
ncbi:MAG: hypothetical protein J0M12_17180, partial [Deltaproteobacteria bacterium]|nr:hypothetical protein [Deltaproteobacteria bacterium]